MKYTVEEVTYNQLTEFEKVHIGNLSKLWRVSFDNGYTTVLGPYEYEDGIYNSLILDRDYGGYNFKSPEELQDYHGNENGK